ncbi:MAG: S-layer homology domain-containing protein [SAR324 cluster bacterium]|nr:S-layer homology domain-containing protein [SAR324 cluster bacterium]
MKPILNRWASLWIALAATALIVAAGCGKEPRKPGSALDTPEHHALRGNDMIDQGNWEDAKREFDLALSLDPEHSQALSGKAVVVAHASTAPGLSPDQREERFERARDLHHEGLNNSQSDADTRVAHVAAIRVHSTARMPADDWLEESRDHYEEALDTEGGQADPHPHFYMARAERNAFNLPEASLLYQRVLSIDRGKTREADLELSIVQKVIRAQPGSRYGKIVAFLESVNRADMAALFIGELQLSRLYTRGNQEIDTSFQPPEPGDFEAERVVAAPEATDIDEHPLRVDIQEVLRLEVVGLEPDPAHRFNPDKSVSRAEFALMVEDILVKVTGETGVRTKFIGSPSPFPDVRNDLPYFNAVQTVITRSLMEPKDKVRGLFGPLEPVSGAEALLVIRLLKDELRSYLRS